LPSGQEALCRSRARRSSRNHPETWPVSGLALCIVLYTEQHLPDVLSSELSTDWGRNAAALPQGGTSREGGGDVPLQWPRDAEQGPTLSGPPIRVLVAARPGLWSELLARQLGSEQDVEVVGRVHDEEQIRLVATTNDPAVIVLDREAFGSGCEGLIARLRRKVPGARTLVFAAKTDDETAVAVVRAGAVGLVGKELGFPVLLTALRAVVAGELWAPRRVTARVLELLQQAERRAQQASRLTRREREVVGAVRSGLRNSEVAEALGITERTVKRHLSNIFSKTGTSDRSELIRLALGAEGERGPAG